MSHVVSPADTAEAQGSGDVPVLATPRVVALLEAATVAATAGHLDSGATSVGVRVEVAHLAPTVTGTTVLAAAELEEVSGRELTFAVRLREGRHAIVAEGRIVRAVVDRTRFLDRAAANRP